MDTRPEVRVPKRGIKKLIGYAKIVPLVILVSFGLALSSVGQAIRRPFRGKKNALILSLILIILGLAMFFGWSWYQTMGDDEGLTHTVARTLDYPSEATIQEDEFHPSPEMPAVITLGSIGAEGIIQQVANDQFGSFASPSNVHAAGWYVASVKPGEVGLSIIDGHIQGRYSKGIFYDLAKLRVHDTIMVSFADGHSVNFEVVDVKTVSTRDALAAVRQKDPSIERQLNLIAITNANDKGTPISNERVIVKTAAKL